MRTLRKCRYAVAGFFRPVAEFVRLLPPNSHEIGYRKFSSTARVSIALLLTCLTSSVALAQPGRQAIIDVSPVYDYEYTPEQTFLGTVTATRRAVVGSAVAGRVEEVFVDDGDFVKLAKDKSVVDGADSHVNVIVKLAQLRVKTIGIHIAAAKAELNLAEQELDQLNESLPEQAAQASARFLATEALLKFAQSKHDRVDQLFNRGSSVSKEQLEEAQSGLEAAKQNNLAAKSALNEINRTEKARRAQAASRVLIRQEEVNRLEDMKNKYTIWALFDGVVVAKHTEVGSWISSGDPIAEVIQLDPVEITVVVPEIYIAGLEEAMEQNPAAASMEPTIPVRLDAFPKREFKASYHRTVPQADIRSRTYPVQLKLDNPHKNGSFLIKPGMLARVTLPVGIKRMATLVPKDALVLGGPRPTVFVVSNGVARMTPVDTGVSIDSMIEVTGDLKDGDEVVVTGNERLRPGPVKIRKTFPTTKYMGK